MMVKAKIGFIGSSAPSSPHLDSFRAFAPKDIDFTFVQEVNPGASLWDAQGKLDSLSGQVNDLIERHKWNGVIISGGPKEVLNAGMWERLAAEVKVPVATALRSSVAALKVFAAARILLMTPVDDKLKDLYRDYLAGFGIEAVYPPQTLRVYTDAQKLTPEDVARMTRETFAAHSGIDAIYFQGALLDPLTVLDQLESELQVPIVASSPARLWVILSQIGLSHKVPGYGKLLATWPSLPADLFWGKR
jgi:maleate cis-trans isomerase